MVKIQTGTLHYDTRGFCDIIDITRDVQNYIQSHDFLEGQVLIFVNGATAGITTVEYEPGLVKDLKAFFERLIPQNGAYYHHETWNDGNGFSHVRASLLKPSISIPFTEGRLTTGTWQQVILVDFDNKSRRREIVLQCLGEK